MKATMFVKAETKSEAMRYFQSRVDFSLLKNIDVWQSNGEWFFYAEEK